MKLIRTIILIWVVALLPILSFANIPNDEAKKQEELKLKIANKSAKFILEQFVDKLPETGTKKISNVQTPTTPKATAKNEISTIVKAEYKCDSAVLVKMANPISGFQDFIKAIPNKVDNGNVDTVIDDLNFSDLYYNDRNTKISDDNISKFKEQLKKEFLEQGPPKVGAVCVDCIEKDNKISELEKQLNKSPAPNPIGFVAWLIVAFLAIVISLLTVVLIKIRRLQRRNIRVIDCSENIESNSNSLKDTLSALINDGFARQKQNMISAEQLASVKEQIIQNFEQLAKENKTTRQDMEPISIENSPERIKPLSSHASLAKIYVKLSSDNNTFEVSSEDDPFRCFVIESSDNNTGLVSVIMERSRRIIDSFDRFSSVIQANKRSANATQVVVEAPAKVVRDGGKWRIEGKIMVSLN